MAAYQRVISLDSSNSQCLF
ncbi:MAG: hypothetical protein V7K48_06650 [Nostoc sp.]